MQKTSTTYIDKNFLNGELKVITNEAKKITLGKFTFYDCNTDQIISFTAVTTCRDDDTYSEKAGIDIVKLKLAKQYYSYKKKCARHIIDKLSKIIRDATVEYTHADKKLNNIKKNLSSYGLSFHKESEKVTKTRKITKTNPRNTKTSSKSTKKSSK